MKTKEKNCFNCKHSYIDASPVFGFCLIDKTWKELTKEEYCKGCKNFNEGEK